MLILRNEKRVCFRWQRKARKDKKGLQEKQRGTLEEKGYWGHTSISQPKEGPEMGKAEAAISPLGWYHVKLSASSLSLWKALFHTQTVAVAPTRLAKRCIQTGSGKKRREAGLGMDGEQGYSEAGGSNGHVQNASPFRPLMSCLCPPWERSGGTKASHSLPPSLNSLFSRMNESLRSGSQLSSIIDADYPNFMQPSQCEEVPSVLAWRVATMQ